MSKIRWGVLGVAKIAVEKVIPAMQRGTWSEVTAIASRDGTKAKNAAAKLGIAKAYGSYEELLADPEIDAIYNPLPNHLHVSWTTTAAQHGKHVLCEKPIALTADEAKALIAARDQAGVKIQEAFMVRTHPQWLKVKEIVRQGQIGDLRAILGWFSYFNVDPVNIRNRTEYGGGALMDVGCYLINTSRFIFDREPARAIGIMQRDPGMGTDRMTSMLLDFEVGHCIGTCSTQMVPAQRMEIFGTKGRIELAIPFNAPPDRPCRITIDSGADVFGGGISHIDVDTCNQYTIQGDVFSKAILDGTDIALPLEDAIKNMACLDAIVQSTHTGCWEVLQ